jgi:hypothetical protein
MYPAGKMLGAVNGGGEGGSVSPLAQRGLDEALGLAVGPGSIGSGAQMLEAQFAASAGEGVATKTRTVVGHDAFEFHAEALIMGHGLLEEGDGGGPLLVGENGGVGQTGMIIDGDKDEVVTGVADGIAGIAGNAEARAMNAGQLLDVDMEEIAGMRPLVTNDRDGREQIAPAVEPMAT